jgi:hypothetical protein
MLNEVAEMVHDVWSNWMEWQFKICIKNKDGSVTIPKDLVDRWTRQMKTHYSDLSLKEQQSDIEIAETYIELFQANE